MRIAILTSCFSPMIGGIETLVAGVARALSMTDDILLFTDQQQRPTGPERFAHLAVPGLAGARNPTEAAAAHKALTAALKDFGPDVIHFADCTMLVHAEAVVDIAPMTVSVHGNDLTSPWIAWPDPLQRTIRNGITRCSKAFVLSDHVAELVAAVNNAPPAVKTPAGCDISRFFPDDSQWEHLEDRYRLRDDALLVITCARIAARKGHLDLYQALVASGLRADWVVVGRGPWRFETRLKLATFHPPSRIRVHMAGHLPDDELRQLLTRADFFAMTPTERKYTETLDSEGYGLTYLEANACGTPVIGTRSGGIPDAVLDGETGLIAQPGNVQDIAAKLRELADNPEVARALGQAGMQRARALGNWNECVRAMRSVFCALQARTTT